jgi:hypothetical protein
VTTKSATTFWSNCRAGRIVEATIKAVDTTDGVRLQVSFGEETALIYTWQIVIEAR